MRNKRIIAPHSYTMSLNKFRTFLIYSALLSVLLLSCCSRANDSHHEDKSGRLSVVVTLFPLYDFARNIAGEKAEVRMLLPPGAEPHSFEPRTSDMVVLSHADIFIYTNRFMEPWAEDLLKSAGSNKTIAVDAGIGVRFIEGSSDKKISGQTKEPHGHNDMGADPHIWLDFSNSKKMVDTIAGAFIAKDPANRDIYTKNAEAYKARLENLDKAYQKGLSGCRKKVFINGGHYIFGYLAERYGLQYQAAYGFSPDAEPTAKNLADISKTLRREGLNYIFYEELLSPRIADTIAKETGAALLKLHGAHNISKEEFNAGRTFNELMEKNLDNLMTGLQCRN